MIFNDVSFSDLGTKVKSLGDCMKRIEMIPERYIEDILTNRCGWYGSDGMLPYYIFPKFRVLGTESPMYYYSIVDMGDGDSVIVLLKNVRMCTNPYFRCICMPYSLGGNRDNEVKVFCRLYVSGMVKHFYLINQEVTYLKDVYGLPLVVEDECADSDYYSELENTILKYHSNRWKYKKKISRFENHTFRELGSMDVGSLSRLRSMWEDKKISDGDGVRSKRMFDNLLTRIESGDSDVISYGVFYKDILVGCDIYIKISDDKAIGVAGMSLDNCVVDDVYLSGLGEDDLYVLDRCKGYTSNFVLLRVTEDMLGKGFKYFYVAGTADKDSPLAQFKKRTNDKIITYYKVIVELNNKR